MKLKQQVCSLEVAKRLKELGAKQEGLYGWIEKQPGYWRLWSSGECENWEGETYTAFTIAELWDLLPSTCPEHGGVLQICPAFSDGAWFVGYGDHMNGKGCHVEGGGGISIPETFAKMLVYLLENKLITP